MAPERTKTVSLRLPADLVAEFDGVARAAGKTRTEAVERAMRAVIAGARTTSHRGTMPTRQGRPEAEPRFKS